MDVRQLPPKPRVWVTGAAGLIGNYLVQDASRSVPDWKIIPLTRERLDLACFKNMDQAFESDRPDLIVHCAALSRPTDCQANPSLAWQINVDVTAHLARLASDIPLLFFSSDLVFDGSKGNYTESDPVNPLNAYAETKAAAEQTILRNPKHMVIRTSLNGGRSPTGNRGFNEEMFRHWKEGRTLQLFTDEYRSPIPASITARAVWELARRNEPGLYHLAGKERLSRWQIGQLLARRHPEHARKMVPTSLKDYAGPPRPPDCSLNCLKIQQRLSFPLPGFGEWLAQNTAAEF